jgi:hypothetical protein
VDSTQAGSLCYTNSPECGVMPEKHRGKLYEPKATTRRANVAICFQPLPFLMAD